MKRLLLLSLFFFSVGHISFTETAAAADNTDQVAGEECPICLELMDEGELKWTLPRVEGVCGHAFHKNCRG